MNKYIVPVISLIIVLLLFLSACGSLNFSSIPSPPTAPSDSSAAAHADDVSSQLSESSAEEPAAEKCFTLRVIDPEGIETEYEIVSSASSVGDALSEKGLISGRTGPDGLFVEKVCGITADYNTDGTYWAFYVNGKPAPADVCNTAAEDGYVYTLIVE